MGESVNKEDMEKMHSGLDKLDKLFAINVSLAEKVTELEEDNLEMRENVVDLETRLRVIKDQ